MGAASAHRQVVGDLTWEVPLELEPEYGLSLEDKRFKQLRRAGAGGGAGPGAAAMEPRAAPAAGAGGPALAEPEGALGIQLPRAPRQQPAGQGQGQGQSQPQQPRPAGEARQAAPHSTSPGNASPAPGASLGPPSSLVGLQRQLLGAAAVQHLQRLVGQLLVSEGVVDQGAWVGVLVRLACEAAALVLPPSMVSNGVLDPRHYIKVRLAAGGGGVMRVGCTWRRAATCWMGKRGTCNLRWGCCRGVQKG